jgi:hypothetical protein
MGFGAVAGSGMAAILTPERCIKEPLINSIWINLENAKSFEFVESLLLRV